MALIVQVGLGVEQTSSNLAIQYKAQTKKTLWV